MDALDNPTSRLYQGMGALDNPPRRLYQGMAWVH